MASVNAVWMASRSSAMKRGVRASVPTGLSSHRAPTLMPSSSRKDRLSGRYSAQGNRSVKDGGR
jgi:hypothetical protein